VLPIYVTNSAINALALHLCYEEHSVGTCSFLAFFAALVTKS